MDAFQFGYGSPGQYADWTKYAGLDRKTGMVGVAPPDQSGAEPTGPADPAAKRSVCRPPSASAGNRPGQAALPLPR